METRHTAAETQAANLAGRQTIKFWAAIVTKPRISQKIAKPTVKLIASWLMHLHIGLRLVTDHFKYDLLSVWKAPWTWLSAEQKLSHFHAAAPTVYNFCASTTRRHRLRQMQHKLSPDCTLKQFSIQHAYICAILISSVYSRRNTSTCIVNQQ